MVMVQKKIQLSFFEACFLIFYFLACVCIYVTYMIKVVFKPMVMIQKLSDDGYPTPSEHVIPV